MKKRTRTKTSFQAQLILPENLSDLDVALLGGVFIDICLSHSALRQENHQESPWVLEWLFEDKPEISSLDAAFLINAHLHKITLPENLEWAVEEIEDRNWLEYSYAQFPAFTVGPFYIHGSHCENDVPEGLIGLQIDAATAFGSGEHGTTKGCLQAMLDLKGQGACPWNILDMGTGSGILAIAAWKLWKSPVLAVDNDPECIVVTERHAKANAVPLSKTDVSALLNEGFAGDTVQARGPYDLIIANILHGPLKEMAADLIACADDNGYVILSGIMHEFRDGVLEAYQALGLHHRKTIEIGEWSTLVMQKA